MLYKTELTTLDRKGDKSSNFVLKDTIMTVCDNKRDKAKFLQRNIHQLLVRVSWYKAGHEWLLVTKGDKSDELHVTFTDQNECEIGTHNCRPGYECYNIEGSFRCNPRRCPEGSRFSSSSGQCERVNCPRGLKAGTSSLCVGKTIIVSLFTVKFFHFMQKFVLQVYWFIFLPRCALKDRDIFYTTRSLVKLKT